MPDPNFFDRAVPPARPSSPSVPLSVYRELAAELQATRVMLDSLHEQNQQLTYQNQNLTHQNQQLQGEIVKVAKATLQMQQVAQAFVSHPEIEELRSMPIPEVPSILVTHAPETDSSDRGRDRSRSGGMNLAVVMAATIAIAFSLGFAFYAGRSFR